MKEDSAVVMKRTLIVGAVMTVTLVGLGFVVIPDMESGLVVIPLFALTGLAGGVTWGVVRFFQRKP